MNPQPVFPKSLRSMYLIKKTTINSNRNSRQKSLSINHLLQIDIGTNPTMKTPDASLKIPMDGISGLVWLFGEVLGRTWRYRINVSDATNPFHPAEKGRIYSFWHSHLLPLAFIFRDTGQTAIISESKDGLRASAVAQRWNHDVIQGSSSHGGAAALRELGNVLSHGDYYPPTAASPDGGDEIGPVKAFAWPLLVQPRSSSREKATP